MNNQNQSRFFYKGISTPIGILIIVVFAVLVGGILAWQFGGFKKEVQTPEVMIPKEEVKMSGEKATENGTVEEKTSEKITKEIVRKTLKELVKGKNQIGNVTFEVIEPLPIAYVVIKEGEVEEGGEGRKIKTYRIDPNIKVEIEFKIDSEGSWENIFTIYQGDEKIDSYKPDWGYKGMMGSEGTVSTFKYGYKKYILISGSSCGMKFCQVSNYLYMLDEESGNLKGPLVLNHEESAGSLIGGNIDLFIGYQNNFYIVLIFYDGYESDCPDCYSSCDYKSGDKMIIRSIGGDNILKDTLIGSGVELIQNENKLYFEVKDNCVNNYYLLTEDGKFIKINKEEI